MKRREFLHLGMAGTVGLVAIRSLNPQKATAAEAGAKKITEKDILKEGQPATIANYCQHPEKQPNKFCPTWKEKPGNCETCMFFNKDNTLTTFKGGKYAHCQLLADPTKPQYVSIKGYCSTYAKKP